MGNLCFWKYQYLAIGRCFFPNLCWPLRLVWQRKRRGTQLHSFFQNATILAAEAWLAMNSWRKSRNCRFPRVLVGFRVMIIPWMHCLLASVKIAETSLASHRIKSSPQYPLVQFWRTFHPWMPFVHSWLVWTL